MWLVLCFYWAALISWLLLCVYSRLTQTQNSAPSLTSSRTPAHPRLLCCVSEFSEALGSGRDWPHSREVT